MKPCFSMNLDPTIASTLEDCFRDAVRIVTQVGLIRAHFQFNGRTCTVYANGRGSVEDSDGRILSYWDVSSPQTMVLEGNNPWMTMAEYDALRERLVSQPIETERESIPFLNSLPYLPYVILDSVTTRGYRGRALENVQYVIRHTFQTPERIKILSLTVDESLDPALLGQLGMEKS